MKHAWLGFVGVWMLSQVAQAADPIGSASCAASTCHGGVIDRGPSWNHSFSTWLAKDSHAGAGRLLRDEDSRAIVNRLDEDAEKSREVYDNFLRQRCISCHATVTPAQCEPIGLLDNAVLAEGVSCESCHGSAEPWLESHVRIDWNRGGSRLLTVLENLPGARAIGREVETVGIKTKRP